MIAPTPVPVCSFCGGRQLVGHPAGLTVRHVDTCARRTAEDARIAGDRDLRETEGARFNRPATETELALLAELHAVTWPPPERPTAVLMTRVEWITPGIRRRTWPQVGVTE